MILVTVGTQLPFDRFIEGVDALAAEMDEPFIAQIGEGSYLPRHMEWHRFVDPMTFDQFMATTRIILSHAGIGTVLNARQRGKPVILFPRRAALGEHRNDHQMATIGVLEGRRGVYVARNIEDIATCLAQPLEAPDMESMTLPRQALLNAITSHIRELGGQRR